MNGRMNEFIRLTD